MDGPKLVTRTSPTIVAFRHPRGASDTWDASRTRRRAAPSSRCGGALVSRWSCPTGWSSARGRTEHPAGDGDRHGRRPVELPQLAELRQASWTAGPAGPLSTWVGREAVGVDRSFGNGLG